MEKKINGCLTGYILKQHHIDIKTHSVYIAATCNFFSTAVILFQLGRTVYMFFRTVVSVIQNLKLLLKLSLLSFSFDPKWHPNRKNAYTFLGPFWWRRRRAGTHIYLGGGLVLLWVVWQGRRFLKLTSHEFVIPFWFLEFIYV